MKLQYPLLICIVGPTAIGKTKLSISLAKAFETEIISADSRQFFKEMNIGTAVPEAEELAVATHHFIQHKSIFEPYSVGEFEKDAIEKLIHLFKKREIVILVGGSGLYVDAIVKGLDIFPEVPKEVRDELNKTFKEKGLALLQKELTEVDPIYAKKIDLHNPQRVIRALEVFRASGVPFSAFRKSEKKNRPFKVLYLGLDAERETIYKRINLRVDKMIDEGLIEEAHRLYKYKDLNALQTVGYKELFLYFENKLTREEAIEEIKKNTRRFAKRQGTWFRKNSEIHWFDYNTQPNNIIEFIKKTLSK